MQLSKSDVVYYVKHYIDRFDEDASNSMTNSFQPVENDAMQHMAAHDFRVVIFQRKIKAKKTLLI